MKKTLALFKMLLLISFGRIEKANYLGLHFRSTERDDAPRNARNADGEGNATGNEGTSARHDDDARFVLPILTDF